MPTVNSALADRALRHQTYLQRYGASIVRRLIALLNRADADIVQKIQQRISSIADAGFDSGPVTTMKLNALLDEVRSLNSAAYQIVGKELTRELQDLAIYETDWQAHQFNATVPADLGLSATPAEMVVAAALKRPFQGRLLNEWLDGLEAAKAARIRDAIRLGLVEGETVDQMVRRIRGTRAMNYADGLMEIDRRGAAAMVRTAVNHVASAAREATFRQNQDILDGVRWISTLDGQTCPICQAQDGKVYDIGSGPRPPEHINCRCTIAPVTKSWKELGFDIEEVPPSTRASMDGQVPDTMTYQDWLSSQSAGLQDEILGPTRGALFRSGGITLDRFVDRSGNELTLDQLRRKDPHAFQRAGV